MDLLPNYVWSQPYVSLVPLTLMDNSLNYETNFTQTNCNAFGFISIPFFISFFSLLLNLQIFAILVCVSIAFSLDAYTDISHDHAWNETSSYNQYRSFHSNRLDRINFSYVNVRIFACALLSLSDSCTFYSLWQSDYWRLHINTCSNFCTMEILRFVPYDIPQLCESSAVQFKSKSNAIAFQPNASIR